MEPWRPSHRGNQLRGLVYKSRDKLNINNERRICVDQESVDVVLWSRKVEINIFSSFPFANVFSMADGPLGQSSGTVRASHKVIMINILHHRHLHCQSSSRSTCTPLPWKSASKTWKRTTGPVSPCLWPRWSKDFHQFHFHLVLDPGGPKIFITFTFTLSLAQVIQIFSSLSLSQCLWPRWFKYFHHFYFHLVLGPGGPNIFSTFTFTRSLAQVVQRFSSLSSSLSSLSSQSPLGRILQCFWRIGHHLQSKSLLSFWNVLQGEYCAHQGLDPQDPPCAHVCLTGRSPSPPRSRTFKPLMHITITMFAWLAGRRHHHEHPHL